MSIANSSSAYIVPSCVDELFDQFAAQVLSGSNIFKSSTPHGFGFLGHKRSGKCCLPLAWAVDVHSLIDISLTTRPFQLTPSCFSISGADLIEAKLGGAITKRVNLSEANLRGANLENAVLSGAGLPWADLRAAKLTEANLVMASGADLREAKLGGANLYGANLSGANLSGAYLGGANLSLREPQRGLSQGTPSSAGRTSAVRTFDGADLAEANLLEANLSAAYLREANLRGAELILPYWCTRTLLARTSPAVAFTAYPRGV